VSLAKEIVSIYDRINWEEFYKEDCDTVELIFQSVDDPRTAIKIMLGMAADNIALRNRMITKIQKALGRRSPAEASGATRVGGSVRKLDRAAEKLIEDLKAARKPSRFAFLCQQAWELSIKIDRSNRRKRGAGAMRPQFRKVRCAASRAGWVQREPNGLWCQRGWRSPSRSLTFANASLG
jgi:hypothetical protein